MLADLDIRLRLWSLHPHIPLWVQSGSGYLAAALVLATFCMGSMRWLRLTGVASNLAFIFYAAVSNIWPVLILHCILLPVNVFRLMQIQLATAAARRLLSEPDSVTAHAELGNPHFLSRAAIADPGAALPLVEREQSRVVQLLGARLPTEAATALGIAPQAAAAAAAHLMDEIDRFLAALVPYSPTAEQLHQIADLHSCNDVLRALHETLGELAQSIGLAPQNHATHVATMVAEGLATLLLHAEEAAHTHAREDKDLLLLTTEDRSGLVEGIRKSSIAALTAGSTDDYRTIFAITALYERAVWLLHRYGGLLSNRPTGPTDDRSNEPAAT